MLNLKIVRRREPGRDGKILGDHRQDGNDEVHRLQVCVCVCVFSSHSFWTSSSLDVPAGVTQEEGHTGFLFHLLSAVRALIFLAKRIQPFLSLVDREVRFKKGEKKRAGFSFFRLNTSRGTKFSGTYGDRGIFIFPVQLTTSRIGNLTRLIHTLLYEMTIHTSQPLT